MRILVVSSTCSARKYKEIFEKRRRPMLDTNQKFFLSLLEGLQAQEDVAVDCVTTLPISYSCYDERFVKQQEEIEGGIFYHYCGCINYPIIRTLTVQLRIKKFVKQYIRKYSHEKIIVLCDGLIGEANSLIKYLKKKKICTVALVTDIPNVVSEMGGKKSVKAWLNALYGEKATKLLKSFDRYVFLTEQMNEVCNPEHRPYMIMECIVTPLAIERLERKKLSEKPVVLYAGKLHSDFGVLDLARAAAYLQDTCEIWLYGGHGDCDSQLAALAAENPNLKIHGIVELAQIHKLERNAQILINPRPNEKIFTRYSFPSKTAEYMMMQVPVVMYKLDGIPDEYDPYLHYIQEQSPRGIADEIKRVLAMEEGEKNKTTKLAREYIIEEKNNINQAKRLVDFLRQ